MEIHHFHKIETQRPFCSDDARQAAEVVLEFRPFCSLVKMDQDFISGCYGQDQVILHHRVLTLNSLALICFHMPHAGQFAVVGLLFLRFFILDHSSSDPP